MLNHIITVLLLAQQQCCSAATTTPDSSIPQQDHAAAVPQLCVRPIAGTFSCWLGIERLIFLPLLLGSRLDTQEQVPAGFAALLRLH
jgi:hypothetical protein